MGRWRKHGKLKRILELNVPGRIEWESAGFHIPRTISDTLLGKRHAKVLSCTSFGIAQTEPDGNGHPDANGTASLHSRLKG